jgi:protein-disulfide isomerase
MTKSKVVVLAVVAVLAGIVMRSLGDKSDTTLPVTAEAPNAAEPTAPSPEPAQAPAPAAEPDSQTDEGAGKKVDVAAVGVSPKDDDSPFLGPKDAPVVVNVFSDFQCPVCKRSADPIKQLVADFPGKVKVFFRNNALPMHGRSKPAAIAAAAAKKQGRFWEYHDKLFSGGQLDDTSLENYAQELGLNMDQWKKDVTDPKLAERVDEEAKWASDLGAVGTPAFFVNGKRSVGWGSYLGLKSLVQREVELSAQGATTKARIVAMASQNSKGDDKEPAIEPQRWAKLLTHD